MKRNAGMSTLLTYAMPGKYSFPIMREMKRQCLIAVSGGMICDQASGSARRISLKQWASIPFSWNPKAGKNVQAKEKRKYYYKCHLREISCLMRKRMKINALSQIFIPAKQHQRKTNIRNIIGEKWRSESITSCHAKCLESAKSCPATVKWNVKRGP